MRASAPDLLLEHVHDPYPYYSELREHDPVHFDERRGNWLVLRYDDVLTLLKDETRLSAQQGTSSSMLNNDPPKHTRLRSLVSQAFTPRRVRELAPRIQEIVDGLLDEAACKDGMDVIQEFAYPPDHRHRRVVGRREGTSRHVPGGLGEHRAFVGFDYSGPGGGGPVDGGQPRVARLLRRTHLPPPCRAARRPRERLHPC